MKYFLLVTKYDFNVYLFTVALLLLHFGNLKKFETIVKAKSAVSGLARMCLTQAGYGTELLPSVY